MNTLRRVERDKRDADERAKAVSEPPKPWTYAHNITRGYHVGGEAAGAMPDYYGESAESSNVPYFPGGNQSPNTCAGGKTQALGCLISIGSSLIPYNYGPANNNANFYLSYNVTYTETEVTVSDIYWSNLSTQPAVFPNITIDGKVMSAVSGYMPTDGNYRPIPGTGGTYDGSRRISIDFVITYPVNTPNGYEPRNQAFTATIPSIQDAKDFLQMLK